MVEYPILKINTFDPKILEDVYSYQYRNVIFPKYNFTVTYSKETIDWISHNCSTSSWVMWRDRLRVYIEDIKEAALFKMFWEET